MKRFFCSLNFGNIRTTAILAFLLLACIGVQTAQAASSDQFITTWKTDNSGTSNDTSITVPMVGGYWSVNWGDGTSQNTLVDAVTHNYAVAGTYIVTISPSFASINFKTSGDKAKILSIDQWGTGRWGNGSFNTSMESAFADLPNLQVPATDTPNFIYINNMRFMFWRSPLANPDTTNWDTSAVTNMQGMFGYATAANPDVSNWNTALVTNMSSMFREATSANPDVSNWNTGRVTTMAAMFMDATSANPDVSGWNTGKLIHTERMFLNATSFDQDLGAWNVGVLKYTSSMFDGIALSTANYDSLLIGWGEQTLQTWVYFYAGGSVYCSAEAAAARSHMETTYTWTFYDGGRCPHAPVDPTIAPDMTAETDSGMSDTDNLTNINTPDFDVACSHSGNTITLYTDNPAADTATGTYVCIGAGTETASVTSALVDEVHNISYTDLNTIGESGHSPSLRIYIKTVAPPQPTCSTTPSPALDGETVTTTCTGVEESAGVVIPNMQCAPGLADATGIVVCTGIVGTGEGEISVSNDVVTVWDMMGNFNNDETTGLIREMVFDDGFE